MGRSLDLPGSPGYAAQYKDWMRTPEAQATFKSDAEQQARLANSLNPYSQGYNATAANAMKTAAGASKPGGAYYTGAGPGTAMDFRNAMGVVLTSAPQGPVAGPGLSGQVMQPPQPPALAPGPVPEMNNFTAAAALRKRQRKTRSGPSGPMAPPQLA